MNNSVYGQRPTLQIGGRVFTDLTNLLIFGANCATAAASQYNPIWLAKGPTNVSVVTDAGYQVTAGKTLIILAAQISVRVAAASAMELGYGDAAVTIGSAAAPANFKRLGAGGATISATTPVGKYETSFNICIPATKYPCFFAQGTQTMDAWFYGYEV